jgi:futalosine hydrolase
MTPLLILIPTAFERTQIQPLIADYVTRSESVIELCGFGPVAAGIRTAQLITKFQPKAVLLVGIAGSFRADLPVGSASCFSRIVCYGVGAGGGSRFKTAGELGWPQWLDSESGQSIGDLISVANEGDPHKSDRLLLTACAASESADDVVNRLHKFPEAVAEDMEAFSVAMACQMAEIPLTVVRGISNIAGDRNKSNWNINGALTAAAELVLSGCSL